jgi:hypothetical protein
MSRSRALKKHPFPGLHQQLIADGWTHRVNGRGHHQYSPPAGRPDAPATLTMPGSPSDWRARRNAERDVRRWTKPKGQTA